MGIEQSAASVITSSPRGSGISGIANMRFRFLKNILFFGTVLGMLSFSESFAQEPSGSSCPEPVAAEESDTKLRSLEAPNEQVKKYKIKKESGKRILVPVAKDAVAPKSGECFFVLADGKSDVVAEVAFQKVQKSKKGVVVWVFSPLRRAKSIKSIVNFSAISVQGLSVTGASNAGVTSGTALAGENPLFFPAFILIQNAQHQAANYRTGNSLNAPVSGFGTQVEGFAPMSPEKIWMNMFGLRVSYESWKSDTLTFQKTKAGESQEALATGNGLQIDVVVRYPLQNRWLTRVGAFVGQANQTEILAAKASAIGPENTQTVERKGLVFGGEVELQPLAPGFFVQGKVTVSTKEAVTATDATPSAETLTSTGTAARLHLTGIAGIRMPLFNSTNFFFEGLVRSTLRSDKFSGDVALLGQENQSDVTTHFHAGVGYKL
jgi:hypothetical protein